MTVSTTAVLVHVLQHNMCEKTKASSDYHCLDCGVMSLKKQTSCKVDSSHMSVMMLRTPT